MELMAERQWKRWDAVARLGAGKLTMSEAARALGLSLRQVRRIRRAVERAGKAGLLHGNQGRVPVNKLRAAVRQRLLRLRRTKYRDFNDQHFTEKLAEEEQPRLSVSVRTVRRVLRAAGVPAVRRRRPAKHRRRRDRKAQAGLMLLWDGSRHAWLEARGPWLCLIAAIDDATGELLPGGHFVEHECAAAYLGVLRAVVAARGVPWSIYMDQHGALRRNDDHWTPAEELRGRQDPTQVGRALEALEIEAIFALSPQAKGRVERLWGTLQDRLVSELRLAGAASATHATAVLERYRAVHNRRFAMAPQEATPAWRPLRRGVDLDRLCSFRYEATVLNDHTIRLAGLVLDIAPGPRGRSYRGKRVEVRQLLDRSWRVYLGDQVIATAPATTHGELRSQRWRKRGRGAPHMAPLAPRLIETSL
jgi:winged helix-turn helix protein